MNGNGMVDKSEIAVFAKNQGLSSEEVLADFQELDINKDGELDSSEIGGLLGESWKVASATEQAVEATAAASSAHQAAAAPTPKDASVQPSDGDLDLVALQKAAQEEAGNVVASRLAQRAQVLLARSDADENKAQQFDAEVRSLRGNATALESEVNEQTRKIARQAVSVVTQKQQAELARLQLEEQKAMVAANEHRTQAKQAMERVRKAQASLHDN